MKTEEIQRALTRSVPMEYEQLIAHMKFYIEPEISCSRFLGTACFTEESIGAYRRTDDADVLEPTEMGIFIKTHLQHGVWIDCPCGEYNAREKDIDFDVAILAAVLGAMDVWEIDSCVDVMKNRLSHAIELMKDGQYALMNGIGEMSQRSQKNTVITAMQDDLLGFTAKISPETITRPKAFYISALQPDTDFCSDATLQRTIAAPYLTALYTELSRVLQRGDLLILNSAQMLVAGIDEQAFPAIHPSLALPPRGLRLMRQCPLNKVWVFLKE